MNETERRDVFAACGADAAETTELLAYGSGAFELAGLTAPLTLPLADEPCVATWDAYADEARRDGAWPTLVRHLPRLRFPVRAGISESDDYRAATLRGVDPTSLAAASGLSLCRPESVTLDVHATPAGRIAVIAYHNYRCSPDDQLINVQAAGAIGMVVVPNGSVPWIDLVPSLCWDCSRGVVEGATIPGMIVHPDASEDFLALQDEGVVEVSFEYDRPDASSSSVSPGPTSRTSSASSMTCATSTSRVGAAGWPGA